MRIIFCIWLLLFVGGNVSGQSSLDFTEMFTDASDVVYSQPQQTIKIVEHLLKNSKNAYEEATAYLLEARAYYVIGDYNVAIQKALEAKKLAENSEEFELQLEITIFGIHLLNLLGLDVAAEKYFEFTNVIVEKSSFAHKSDLQEAGRNLLNAYSKFKSEAYAQAVPSLLQAKALLHKTQLPNAVVETQITLVEFFPKAVNIDSAEIELENQRNELDQSSSNDFLKMIILNRLGEVYFLKKDYVNAQAVFTKALKIAEDLSNAVYKYIILENTAINSLAMDQSENFYAHKKIANELSNEVETNEENAVNSVFNYTSLNHTAKRNLVSYRFKRNTIILGSILAFVLLTWLALRIRYRSRIKQYEDFIRYFENRKAKENEINLPRTEVSTEEISKSLNIPKETEENLIRKLNQFENSTHFTKKDMSLAQLASQFETNTKYLSEVINFHKNKNFNTYINELRINYIIEVI